MKTRIALSGLVGLALLLSGTAASADVPVSGTSQVLHLVKVPRQCADFRADLHTVALDPAQYDALVVCDSLGLGDAMRPLRTVDMAWDLDCLSSHGWVLDASSNVPVPPLQPDGPLQAADLGSCGTPLPSDAQCAQFEEGIQPGNQPRSVTTAAVLDTLGCNRPAGA